jgi:hypothetical protein
MANRFAGPRRSVKCIAFGVLVLSAALFSNSQAGAATVTVPPSIDGSGQQDVTAALNSFIASVPDESLIAFPAGARYRIEGTLLVAHRNGLTFEGNGAEFFATTPSDRDRRHWKVVGGSRIVFRNVVVRGANPSAGTSDAAYDSTREAQHGFDFQGTAGIELDRVTVTDVYGDFVYLGKFVVDGGPWSRDVWIHDSHFERNGRQGISLTGAENVLIERNTIAETRRATFDLEPNGDGWGVRNLRIVHNTIGHGRLKFVASMGNGPVDDITIEGNTLVGRALDSTFMAPKGTRRFNLRIAGNTSDTWYGNPDGVTIYVVRYTGVRITGNTQPLPPNNGLVGGWEDCDVVIADNSGGSQGGTSPYDGCPPPPATTTTAPPATTSTSPVATAPTPAVATTGTGAGVPTAQPSGAVNIGDEDIATGAERGGNPIGASGPPTAVESESSDLGSSLGRSPGSSDATEAGSGESAPAADHSDGSLDAGAPSESAGEASSMAGIASSAVRALAPSSATALSAAVASGVGLVVAALIAFLVARRRRGRGPTTATATVRWVD